MTTAVFTYIDPTSLLNSDGSANRPWNKVDIYKTSFDTVQRTCPVVSLRDATKDISFGVDISGFGFFDSPAPDGALVDENAIRGRYYPHIERLVRDKLPGASRVVIFDHTVRRHEKTSPRQPVQLLHVDQTPQAADARVLRHITDLAEAEKLLKARYQIINVWRPIANPASDAPLAVVDWRTTQPEDCVEVDLMYPKSQAMDSGGSDKEVLADAKSLHSIENYEPRGSQYVIAPSDKHVFYYAPDMSPREVLFIKCFDSRGQDRPGGTKGLAGFTPHTAFVDPNTPADAPARQSIEVRCLVFYNED